MMSARLDLTTLRPLDLAEANLRIAEGLPGWGRTSIREYMTRVDRWTRLSQLGTRRMVRKFERYPKYYDDSIGIFRTLTLLTVLHKNLSFRYVPHLRESASAFRRLKLNEARPGDVELAKEDGYADSRNLFIHGLLDGHGGTCTSMPVLLYVIGRRLGYPLQVMSAPQHLFVRWDGNGERFNIEATSDGLRTPRDDEFGCDPSELQVLTHDELLGDFIAIRGHCLYENGRVGEAIECFEQSFELRTPCEQFARDAARIKSKWEFHLQRLSLAFHATISTEYLQYPNLSPILRGN